MDYSNKKNHFSAYPINSTTFLSHNISIKIIFTITKKNYHVRHKIRNYGILTFLKINIIIIIKITISWISNEQKSKPADYSYSFEVNHNCHKDFEGKNYLICILFTADHNLEF